VALLLSDGCIAEPGLQKFDRCFELQIGKTEIRPPTMRHVEALGAVAQLVGSCVGVMGARLWCLAGARHAAAGWGIMPEPIVRDDLGAGA
jgi:hypothetical protein